MNTNKNIYFLREAVFLFGNASAKKLIVSENEEFHFFIFNLELRYHDDIFDNLEKINDKAEILEKEKEEESNKKK